MKETHLLVPKNRLLRAPRKTKTQNPRTVIPNRYWGIDMTKVMIPAFGWVSLHVVIDWGTKKLLSVHMSLSSKSSDWIVLSYFQERLFRETAPAFYFTGVPLSCLFPAL